MEKKGIGEIYWPILGFFKLTDEEKLDFTKGGSQASSLLDCQEDYGYN
jgi:hypothetical protein